MIKQFTKTYISIQCIEQGIDSLLFSAWDPKRNDCNIEIGGFQTLLMIHNLSIFNETALKWMPQDLAYE